MELLVKAVDHTHSDPQIDAEGAYKRGDIIVVMPDGHTWGFEEVKPPTEGGKAYIVKIPGVDHMPVKEMLESPERSDMVFGPDKRTGVPTRRRAHQFDFSKLAANTLKQLHETGTVTLTQKAAQARVLHKASKKEVLS